MLPVRVSVQTCCPIGIVRSEIKEIEGFDRFNDEHPETKSVTRKEENK